MQTDSSCDSHVAKCCTNLVPDSVLWHNRLGHTSSPIMNKVLNDISSLSKVITIKFRDAC